MARSRPEERKWASLAMVRLRPKNYGLAQLANGLYKVCNDHMDMCCWTDIAFQYKNNGVPFFFFSFLLCVGILGVKSCCWFFSSLFLLAIMYVRYLTIVCWILSTSVLMTSLGIFCFHIIMLWGYVLYLWLVLLGGWQHVSWNWPYWICVTYVNALEPILVHMLPYLEGRVNRK